MSGFIAEDEHEIHFLFTLSREELLIETSKLRSEARKLKGTCAEYLQIIKDTKRKLNEIETLYHSKLGTNGICGKCGNSDIHHVFLKDKELDKELDIYNTDDTASIKESIVEDKTLIHLSNNDNITNNDKLNTFINSSISLRPTFSDHYESDNSSSCYSDSDEGSISIISTTVTKCDRQLDGQLDRQLDREIKDDINIIHLNISDTYYDNDDSDKYLNREINNNNNNNNNNKEQYDNDIEIIEMSLLHIDNNNNNNNNVYNVYNNNSFNDNNNNKDNNNNNIDLETSLDTYLKSLLKKRTSLSPSVKSSSSSSKSTPVTKKSNINASPIPYLFNKSTASSVINPIINKSTCSTNSSTTAKTTSKKEIDYSKYISIDTSEWEVVLLIDKREKDHQLIKRLMTQRDILCEVETLVLGDFIWVARRKDSNIIEQLEINKKTKRNKTIIQECNCVVLDCIVERKTVSDLASSIIDGRYNEQKLRLRDCNIETRMYIVEGVSASSGLNQYSHSVSAAGIKTACIDTCVGYGLQLYKTRSLDETIKTLQTIHRHLVRRFNDISRKHDYLPMNEFKLNNSKKSPNTVKEMNAYQLKQIYGISSSSAIALVNKYGTISNLMSSIANQDSNTTINKLSNLRKEGSTTSRIGEKVANHLYRIFATKF